jgi:hypothetical protein
LWELILPTDIHHNRQNDPGGLDYAAVVAAATINSLWMGSIFLQKRRTGEFWQFRYGAPPVETNPDFF